MSRNGSGVYSLPAGNPVVTGTTISSSWANTTLSDIATALTGSVAADGQTAMTGNLQMANNKITGLAVASASGDALSYGQAATISALTVSGTFAANGGATLGDGSGDALTINSSAVSAPNGLNFNSNALVLNTSGNLGLGVTPSASTTYPAFEVGAGNCILGAQGFIDITNNAFYEGSYKYKGTGGASFYEQTGAAHYWYNAPSGTAGNAITFTQAMTLDADGDLGIGTTSPTQKLHMAIGSASTIYHRIQNSAGDCYLGLSAAGNTELSADNTGNQLIFKTVAAERARIDASGNLLVGRTSTSGFGSTGVQVEPTGQFVMFRAQNSTIQSFYNFTAQTLVGSISIGTTTTSYNTSSDYRLKENIAPMTGALDVVQALKPVTYSWKLDGSSGQGFIAHELQEVVPECVTGEKDAVNEDGSIKPQGIDTSFLVATLTAAIQEQQAIITDLKARIESLENK